MGGISVLFLLFMFLGILLVILTVEAISLGFLVSGIVLAISFAAMSKKKKIGNKVAVPIVLITLGITGILPMIYLLIQ
ncbi:MAG: hypothetical protein Q4D02_06855 [Clostridia bacterium]|nr:hypothetical protein [Clostridia bacterium]